jgi:kynurenine--oxoglutarate transaminase/cysteine-S-conjugate beta-lyase/glutamine--phenylpyruvate transaminase
MYERTITVGSAGKAFSVTGWKLGWAMGPSWLLDPLKKVHQNCVFTCSTPTQEGIAQAFEKELELIKAGKTKESYLLNGLSSELLPKRDRLANYLRNAGFNPILPEAGYFMMADFSHLDGPFKEEGKDPLDYRFVRWMCREKKLATIPPSAFYSPEHKKGNDHLIRLCFFKKDETLSAAEQILQAFSEEQKRRATAHD